MWQLGSWTWVQTHSLPGLSERYNNEGIIVQAQKPRVWENSVITVSIPPAQSSVGRQTYLYVLVRLFVGDQLRLLTISS